MDEPQAQITSIGKLQSKIRNWAGNEDRSSIQNKEILSDIRNEHFHFDKINNLRSQELFYEFLFNNGSYRFSPRSRNYALELIANLIYEDGYDDGFNSIEEPYIEEITNNPDLDTLRQNLQKIFFSSNESLKVNWQTILNLLDLIYERGFTDGIRDALPTPPSI